MKTFFLIIFNPKKTFSEIKTANKSHSIDMIILLFLLLLNSILMIPIAEKITSITFSSMSLPEDQKDTLIQIAYKMRYLRVAGSVITYIIMFFFYALLLYLLVRIAKDTLKFKDALLLIAYSYFIVTIGDLINTGFLYMRGLDAIGNTYDTSLIGLNMVTSVEQIGATLYTFLSYINPFQLTFVFLLSIGLKVFTEVKYMKSLIISILFWLITILIPTFSVYFSQLSIAKSGIM